MDRRPDVVLTVRSATSFFTLRPLFQHNFFYQFNYFPLGPGYDPDPHGSTSPTSRQAVSGQSPAVGGKPPRVCLFDLLSRALLDCDFKLTHDINVLKGDEQHTDDQL